MKEPFYYTEGAEIEMFIDGKWTRGKVVNGYRFREQQRGAVCGAEKLQEHGESRKGAAVEHGRNY